MTMENEKERWKRAGNQTANSERTGILALNHLPESTTILTAILFELNWQLHGPEIIATMIWILTSLFAFFTLTYDLKGTPFPSTVRKEIRQTQNPPIFPPAYPSPSISPST
ncbi:MAG: hypothetical protein Q9180_002524 [Flavoplaca navasiana]